MSTTTNSLWDDYRNAVGYSTTTTMGNDGYEILHVGKDEIVTYDGKRYRAIDISEDYNNDPDDLMIAMRDAVTEVAQQTPIEYSHEILFHFTCPQCNRWWSHAAADDTWHVLVEEMFKEPITCMHCGYTAVVAEKQ